MEIPMDYIFQKPKINPDHIPGRKDLIQFFNRKKLQQYVEMFPKTVNFAFFKTMGEDDFSEYGILPESNDMQVLLKAVNDAQLEEEAEDQKLLLETTHDVSVPLSPTTAPTSPTTPTHSGKRYLECSSRKTSLYMRSSSFEPLSPNSDNISNLVRMRTNSTLGNSDPALSSSTKQTVPSSPTSPSDFRERSDTWPYPFVTIIPSSKNENSDIVFTFRERADTWPYPYLDAPKCELGRKASTCGMSPRRPRSLLPHSPSPPRANSPVPVGIHLDESPKHASNNPHPPVPYAIVGNKSLQSGRRWSVASSGYSTNTPCSSGFSSRTSSHEKLNQLQLYDSETPLCRQYSHDSTYSDVDDDIRCRSPRPFRGRSRSLSPTRSENEVSILNKLYEERFPKAKAQMEEQLQSFIDDYHEEIDQCQCSDPALSFVAHQCLEIAKTVLRVSLAEDGNITSNFFHEITESLEKLVEEAKTKTTSSLEQVNKMVSDLLFVLSRPARLLECLEFDPGHFYSQLEMEEVVLNEGHVNIDMGKYIRMKLGIQEEVEEEEEEEEEKPPLRKVSIIAEPKEEDFTSIKHISSGAYGSVYLVRHRASRQRYAMKKTRKHRLMHKNQVQQVFTERDIMTFAQNPFVVTLVCTFETKKYLCMVMEYVEGGDCASLLKNIGIMTADLARRYIAETLLAVEYIHDYGIIHRDLKPDNLLITAMGHIKLTDFGLSKVGLMNMTTNICEQTTQFNDLQLFGTPDYIAPEVILRKGYGKPVDYWSLGIILYEFLIGVTPFYGETVSEVFEMTLNGDIEWPDGDDALPSPAVDLIKALLVREPYDRLGTVSTLEVKEHRFFKYVNWESLLREKAEFIPVLDDEEDTSYFDTREDRYNHLVSDEDDDMDDEDEIEIGNFSTCSPRFSRLLSTSELKDFPTNPLKDLEEASSKEASSVEDLSCEGVIATDGFPKLDITVNEMNEPDTKKKDEGGRKVLDERDGEEHAIPEVNVPMNIPVSIKTILLDEKCGDKSDSGNDSGTQTSSSLDACPSPYLSDTTSGNSSKTYEDDQDTDLSDISPRFHSTASFANQRVPSPRLPSPLIIDTSREEDATLKVIQSEPNTPCVKTPSGYTKLETHSPSASSRDQAKLTRTRSTPPYIDLSKVNIGIPRLELSASEDELSLMLKRPSRRRNTRHHLRRRGDSITPPESPRPEKDRRRLSSPIAVHAPIVITRGSEGFGFTLKAIRVYIGETSNYTVHHLVDSVEVGGAAAAASLSENHLITHINGESIQGLQHVDVVRLILRGGETCQLTVTDLSNTTIRLGTKRKTVGSRVLSRKLRSRSRNSSTEDAGRSTSRRSKIYKLRKPSIRRTSSLKKAGRKSVVTPPTICDKHHEVDACSNAASTATSPPSPNSQASRPAFLHGVLPKLARSVVHSPRRRSISCIPVSPLARTPSVLNASARSPSPLTTKSGGTVMSPTNTNNNTSKSNKVSVNRPSSPLLRRALSPDRNTPPPLIKRDDSACTPLPPQQDSDGNFLLPGDVYDRKLIRSQSMKETTKSRKGKHKK